MFTWENIFKDITHTQDLIQVAESVYEKPNADAYC